MEAEQVDEFSEIERKVIENLRSGAFIDDQGWPICRFVVLSAFSNPYAWDVRSVRVRREPGVPQLFRSCWRRDLDYQAFGSPVERLKHPLPYRPTIEVGSVSIDANNIDMLIYKFRRIPISLGVSAHPAGCDGVHYELEIGDYFCNARIVWWVRLPEEWAALGPVIQELTALFESSWPLPNAG